MTNSYIIKLVEDKKSLENDLAYQIRQSINSFVCARGIEIKSIQVTTVKPVIVKVVLDLDALA